MLETFINFVFSVPVPTLPGVETVPLGTPPEGEGKFGTGAPNGLNCEKKFVPAVLPSVVPAGWRKYKNPKIAIAMMTRIIIKSVKFLLDIKIIYLWTRF